MANTFADPNQFIGDIFVFDKATKSISLKEGWRFVTNGRRDSLVDTSGWKVGGTMPPLGFSMYGALSGNSLVTISDTFGFGDVAWRMGGVANESSGFEVEFTATHDRMYRVICYLRKSNASPSGVTTFGCSSRSSLALDGATEGSDFITSAQLTNMGGDMILVGIIHPNGASAVDSGIGGIYDAESFEKLTDGTERMNRFGTTKQSMRVSFSSSDADEYQYAWHCIVQEIFAEQNTVDNLRAICNDFYLAANDQVNSQVLVLPGEKPEILRRWTEINGNGSTTGSYWIARSNALTLGINTDAFDDARDEIYSALYTSPGVLAAGNFFKPTAVPTVEWWNGIWEAYYSAETMILAAISAKAVENSARYLGKYEAAHPAAYNNLDWWIVYDTDDSPVQRGVWYNLNGTPTRISMVSGETGFTTDAKLIAKFPSALNDIAWAEAEGYGTAANYGIEAYFESFAAVTAFIQNLFAQQIEVPDGGRMRFYNGQGVQKRAVELAEDHIDWLDTPDTTPASDELLRGRIGRLGVGKTILMDGQFCAPIEAAWSAAETLVSSANQGLSIVRLKNGDALIAYSRVATAQIYTRTYSNGVFGSEVAITGAIGLDTAICQLDNGDIYLVYQLNSTGNIVGRRYSGGAWGAEELIYAIPVLTLYIKTIAEDSSGVLHLLYYRTESDSHIMEILCTEGVWGTPVDLFNEAGYSPSVVKLKDKTLLLVYCNNTTAQMLQRIYTDGAWGSSSLVNATPGGHTSIIQRLDDSIHCIYKRGSDGAVVECERVLGTWGALKVTNIGTDANYPRVFQVNEGSFKLLYSVSVTGYILQRTLERYAQLGAGIIESGSDANGYYRKFSDGTMEQWGVKKDSGTMYFGDNVYFKTNIPINMPGFFIDTSWVINTNCGIGESNYAFSSFFKPGSTGQALGVIQCNYNYSATERNIYWRAIGRWRA